MTPNNPGSRQLVDPHSPQGIAAALQRDEVAILTAQRDANGLCWESAFAFINGLGYVGVLSEENGREYASEVAELRKDRSRLEYAMDHLLIVASGGPDGQRLFNTREELDAAMKDGQ